MRKQKNGLLNRELGPRKETFTCGTLAALTTGIPIRDQRGNVIDEKEVATYAGLLSRAHEEGLKQIETAIIQFPMEENGFTAVCAAIVETEKGTFAGIGDANPENVNRKIVPQLIRMAETRAKARALRDAVNIGVVAMEELCGEEPDAPPSAPAPAAVAMPSKVRPFPQPVGRQAVAPVEVRRPAQQPAVSPVSKPAFTPAQTPVHPASLSHGPGLPTGSGVGVQGCVRRDPRLLHAEALRGNVREYDPARRVEQPFEHDQAQEEHQLEYDGHEQQRAEKQGLSAALPQARELAHLTFARAKSGGVVGSARRRFQQTAPA